MQIHILIDYLLVMVARKDWHGVSDAANDLRELEAEAPTLMSRTQDEWKKQANDQA